MINSLTLHNFQAYQEAEITLSSGINVFTGDNDNGKSAIVRALYWLFRNKPSGDEFINWNASECSVKANVNGNIIERHKGTNKNKYVINGSNYNAVRSDVPDDLQNIAKVTPTNIQMEDDSHFLLNSSPSEVARRLNDVVGLNKIDDSLQHPNRIIRRMNSSINHIQNDITQKEAQKEKLEKIGNVKKKNDHLNSTLKSKTGVDDQIQEVISIIDDLEEQQVILDEENTINILSKKTDKLEQTSQKFSEVNNDYKELKRIIRTLQKCNSKINKLQPIENLTNSVTRLTKLHEQQSDKKSHLKDVSKTIKSLRSCGEEIETIQNELNTLQNSFEKEKRKIGVCPTCERSFS